MFDRIHFHDIVHLCVADTVEPITGQQSQSRVLNRSRDIFAVVIDVVQASFTSRGRDNTASHK